LLNEYLSETDFPCSLTTIPVEEIKKAAAGQFGLPAPTFKVGSKKPVERKKRTQPSKNNQLRKIKKLLLLEPGSTVI